MKLNTFLSFPDIRIHVASELAQRGLSLATDVYKRFCSFEPSAELLQLLICGNLHLILNDFTRYPRTDAGNPYQFLIRGFVNIHR